MLSIISVNYKTSDYLSRMLETLHQHTQGCDFEVFVVENASGDDLSLLETKYPKVKFIYNDQNLGFACACNRAIKQAQGDYFVLVNPDIIFVEDALSKIEQQMNQDREVGVGGISLKNLDSTQQACVWRFPRPLDQLLLLLKIPHLIKNVGPVDQWLMKDFDYSRSAEVDQVMGAFFCIRREVIEQIGPLDEGFFMWYEEVDFCRRAKNAGWKVRYYADISARHKKGSSFDRVATLKKQAMIRCSLRRYMRKHHGFWAWLLFTLPEPIYVIIALISSIVKPK
ncbi:glycosyltransferase family 2 protein [Patescibacteria group bacterium]